MLNGIPFFLTLEGIDGSGKDTQAALVRDALEARGIKPVVTQEPFETTALGTRIRAMLYGEIKPPESNYEFQRLFVQNRREHIERVIRPALDRGEFVISVRYWLSTIAYGMSTGSSAKAYLDLHREEIGDEMEVPHLTVVIDITADEAVARLAKAGRTFDHFAKRDRLERIRECYLAIVHKEWNSEMGAIDIVNGMNDAGKVTQDIMERIQNAMAKTA